jgi:hypothetical protein
MQRLLLAIFFLMLTCFQLTANAATDSTYATLILGSAGYQTEYGFTPRYARQQADLIRQLTSAKLAEEAVRTSYDRQQVTKTETQIKIDAKTCAQSLRISHRSGDTVWLAFGNPPVVALNPVMYLNRLMMVFIGDNFSEALDRNRKTTDSLDKLMDKYYMELFHVRDTLFSFHDTREFTNESLRLLQALNDTVRLMKQTVNTLIHSDTLRMTRIFRNIDTLLAQLNRGYADSLSENFRLAVGDVNPVVFKLEFMLSAVSTSLRVMTGMIAESTADSLFLDRQASTMIDIIEEQLNMESLDHYLNRYETYDLPVKGKKFQPVLSRYRKKMREYSRLQYLRTQAVTGISGAMPHGKVICTASSYQCIKPNR